MRIAAATNLKTEMKMSEVFNVWSIHLSHTAISKGSTLELVEAYTLERDNTATPNKATAAIAATVRRRRSGAVLSEFCGVAMCAGCNATVDALSLAVATGFETAYAVYLSELP
jgi:hypothetical protein